MPAAAAKSNIEKTFLRQTRAKDAEAAKSFIAQALTDWGEEPLPGWSAADMAGLASDLWAAADEAGDQPLVRLRKRQGPTGLDLLEIVQDDAPFLVSSVMAEVAAHGADVRGMIHPVVDLAGRRRSLMQVAMAPMMESRALIE